MTKTSFERSVQSKEEKQQIESVAMKRIVVKRKRKGINGYSYQQQNCHKETATQGAGEQTTYRKAQLELTDSNYISDETQRSVPEEPYIYIKHIIMQ